VSTPYLRLEDTGEVFELRGDITTVGRGDGVDVKLDEPSVSRLHAELVRRGPHVYVTDLGLSSNGTRVSLSSRVVVGSARWQRVPVPCTSRAPRVTCRAPRSAR